jgi:IS5 family transposase
MSSQVEMISLEELVSTNHIYRKFKELWDFSDIKNEVEEIEIDSDHKGFGTFRLFLCLLIQFTEDLSDRELERYLEDTNSY